MLSLLILDKYSDIGWFIRKHFFEIWFTIISFWFGICQRIMFRRLSLFLICCTFFHEYLYSVTLLLRKWKVQTSTTFTDFIYLTLTVKLLSIDSLQRTWQTQIWWTNVPINRMPCYFRKAGKRTEVGVTNLNYFLWYKIYTPRYIFLGHIY